MSEDRIYEKLDNLERKSTDVLIGLARLEEQIKDVPDLKNRVAALERWKWVTMGAMATSGVSLLTQFTGYLKGI